jgi:hypothetical protein
LFERAWWRFVWWWETKRCNWAAASSTASVTVRSKVTFIKRPFYPDSHFAKVTISRDVSILFQQRLFNQTHVVGPLLAISMFNAIENYFIADKITVKGWQWLVKLSEAINKTEIQKRQNIRKSIFTIWFSKCLKNKQHVSVHVVRLDSIV